MNDLFPAWSTQILPRLVLDMAWQSSLIALMAWMAIRTLVRKPAARSWLALLALGLCFAAPCLSLIARAGGLCLLPDDNGQAQAVAPRPLDRSNVQGASAPVEHAPPEASGPHAASREGQAASASPGVAFLEENGPAAARSPNWSATSAEDERRSAALQPVRPWIGAGLMAAWIAATCMLGWRLAIDIAALRRLCREASRCDDAAILAACDEAARLIGLRRTPAVTESPQVHCPAVVAWRRAQLLVPRGAGERSLDEWLAVFCHELAHVRRGDCWSRLVFDLGALLLPWQPLVWMLRREHQRACEEACDDWALAVGAQPADFAAALANWIPRRQASLAASFASSAHLARRRIERLLACAATPQPSLSRRSFAGGLAAALLLAGLLALAQSAPPDASDPRRGADLPAKGHRPEVAWSASHQPAPRADDPRASDEAAWRVMARLGDARWKHWQPARVLGFDAAGKRILSTSRDGTIRFWEAASGRQTRSLEASYTAATLSSNRRKLILGRRDGTIVLIDSDTAGELQTVATSEIVPWTVAASGDGGRLAISDARRIAVIDAGSGNRIFSLPPDGAPLGRSTRFDALALSPDGRILAAGEGSRSGLVTLWDVGTGEALATLPAAMEENAQQPRSLTVLAFSPDGQSLLTRAVSDAATIWDVASGKARTRLDLGVIFSAGFSPDGASIATSDNQRVTLWDTRGGKRWSTYLGYVPSVEARDSMAFSPEGRILAIGRGHQVRLFDAATGADLNADAATNEVVSASLHPDNRRLATGGSEGEVALWDLVEMRRRHAWTGHRGRIGAVAFSPDGLTLATVAEDATLVLWDVATRRARRSLTGAWSRRNDLAFSPDGKRLASQVGSGAHVWEVDTGRLLAQLRNDRQEILGSLAFSPDGKTLYGAGKETVAAWDVDSGNLLRRIGGRIPSLSPLAICPDGQVLATRARNADFDLWSVSGGPAHRFDPGLGRQSPFREPPLPRKQLQALAFGADGQWLASSSEDGAVDIQSLRDARSKTSLQVGPAGGLIREIHVSLDGRRLIAVNGDGTVSVIAKREPSSS